MVDLGHYISSDEFQVVDKPCELWIVDDEII